MNEPRYLLKEHRHRGKRGIAIGGKLFCYASKEFSPASAEILAGEGNARYCVPSRDDLWEVHPRSPLASRLFSTPDPEGNP